ncbi:MAG: tryptophan synthase subunit alpha [Xanthomonadaceae bacterium]|nr:tryptophan synthase subunit alpha [Xanthomonadaceae bacterium]
MSARYERMFAACAERDEGAVIPFLMLGDPDSETSIARINKLVAAGAHALELGIPFSDPVADGPVIVAAANRALTAGVTPARCFELVAQVRARHPDIPIGLLVYANLVFARGIDAFYRDAAVAGVDSVLVADVPLRESVPFRAAAVKHGVAHVLILPPDANDKTIVAVAKAGAAYTYVLGRAGVTGADRAAAMPARERLELLAQAGGPPPVIGFGISKPEHAHAARAAGAAGVIVGSALIGWLHDGNDAAARFVKLVEAARGTQ